MRMVFDEVKATQAASLFLKMAGKPLNFLALIKLLYKADRESLRRFGLPITTDKYVSMKLGPVTSHIYDRIKASSNPSAHPTFWSTHIQKSPDDPLLLELRMDPGDSELSPVEEDLISEIFATDGAKDRFDLVDACHKDFPEWRNPGTTSYPLEISEIIAALGLSEEEASQIESSIDKQKAALILSV